MMSVDKVKQFYEALTKDKALQEKFKALGEKYQGQTVGERQADAIYEKELLPLAKEAGYDFTFEELTEYGRDAVTPAARQLSDEELAAVAGGAVCACVVAGWGNLDGGFTCGCAFYGQGQSQSESCVCAVGGGGH